MHLGLFYELYCLAFPWVPEVNELPVFLSLANTLINFNQAKFTINNKLKSSQDMEPRANACSPHSLSDASRSVFCDLTHLPLRQSYEVCTILLPTLQMKKL